MVAPLRVPLDTQQESGVVGAGDGFHHTVRCHRLRHQTRRQIANALPVQRVDLDLPGAEQPLQQSPGPQGHRVRRHVLLGPLRGHVFPMVHQIGNLMQPRVQGAAQRHVELLHPAAHREQRHFPGHGAVHELQRQGVPLGIAKQFRVVVAAVVARRQIAHAARQEHAVGHVEQRVQVHVPQQGLEILAAAERRQQQRPAVGTVGHGIDVLLPHAVKRVDAHLLDVAGDQHHGLATSACRHVTFRS